MPDHCLELVFFFQLVVSEVCPTNPPTPGRTDPTNTKKITPETRIRGLGFVTSPPRLSEPPSPGRLELVI